MFICNGILFNHESPRRRSETFVARKITIGLSRIVSGLDKYVELGNLYAMGRLGTCNGVRKNAVANTPTKKNLTTL